MNDLKYRLEQFREELDSSIGAAKGNCNKVALENFTDDLKDLDNIIRDLANDVTQRSSGLHLQRATHRFIISIAEQYDIEPSKVVIGSKYGALVVQKYDEGEAGKAEIVAKYEPNLK